MSHRRFKRLICSVTIYPKTEAMILLKSVPRISYLAPLTGILLHEGQSNFQDQLEPHVLPTAFTYHCFV